VRSGARAAGKLAPGRIGTMAFIWELPLGLRLMYTTINELTSIQKV
jgi:hypothetical protein